MNFEKALNDNVISKWEYDLICIVNENAQFIDEDQIASDALNEILERVWQFEACGGIRH